LLPHRLDFTFEDTLLAEGFEVDESKTGFTSTTDEPAVLIVNFPIQQQPYVPEDFPENEMPGVWEDSRTMTQIEEELLEEENQEEAAVVLAAEVGAEEGAEERQEELEDQAQEGNAVPIAEEEQANEDQPEEEQAEEDKAEVAAANS